MAVKLHDVIDKCQRYTRTVRYIIAWLKVIGMHQQLKSFISSYHAIDVWTALYLKKRMNKRANDYRQIRVRNGIRWHMQTTITMLAILDLIDLTARLVKIKVLAADDDKQAAIESAVKQLQWMLYFFIFSNSRDLSGEHARLHGWATVRVHLKKSLRQLADDSYQSSILIS